MQLRTWGCLAVLVLLVVCSTHTAAAAAAAAGALRYAVIIDAGSTGSRAHVFSYSPAPPGAPYPLVHLPEAVTKTRPGLSAGVSNPAAAAHSLHHLLQFAKDKVPEQQWGFTPLTLLATAGVRMLNASSAQAILAAVDEVLSGSGFMYAGSRVLAGAEEGLLGWVAVNYASGALQAAAAQQQQRLGRKDVPKGSSSSRNSSSTAAVPMQGVLELGGGSLQVTFLPAIPPPSSEASPLDLPSLGPDRLYSRSFDGLGLQAAMSKWSSHLAARQQSHDPCKHTGFTAAAAASSSSSSAGVRGSGDWRACKAGVVSLLPQGPPCAFASCGLAGTFMPPVQGTMFLGVDNLHYTAAALGLPTSRPTSLSDLDKAAATFCGYSWSHVKSQFLRKHKGDPADSYQARVCFSAALIISLLREGLHLPASSPLLTASNSITTPTGQALEAKWPLGALLVGLLGSQGSALRDTALNPRAAAAGPQPHRGHGHPVVQGSAGDEGLSVGSAAALAVAFCLALLALTLCASWLGVGLPGNSRCWLLWQRLQWATAKPTGWLGSSGGGSTSGGGTGVRYMRVWPASGGDGPRPRSRSASPVRWGGTDEGAGSVMLAVLPVSTGSAGEGTTAWPGDQCSNGVSGGTAAGGSKAARPSTARQR